MDDFDEFVHARADELLRVAYLMCGDRHQAEDLLQDVLEQMYLRWRRISVSPEAYARRALVNRSINHWRWRRRHREAPLDHAQEPAIADHATDVSGRDRVLHLLGTLGGRQRAAIVLRCLNGMSVAEVADMLGCSEPTVRSRPTLVADVRTGAMRRRRRRRFAGGTAIAAAAVVVASAVAAGGLRSVAGPDNSVGTPVSTSPSPNASPPPAAPKSCQLDRLPVPDGHPRSVVTGGDRTGRFLVGRAYGSTGHVDKHPLLIWDDGKLTRVDMPGDDEQFTDINRAGTAVGASFAGSDTQRAYIYRDGALTRLPAPNGSVEARAINDRNVIVGNLGGSTTPGKPLVWRDPAAQPQLLPLPAGYPEGRTTDVDADGTCSDR